MKFWQIQMGENDITHEYQWFGSENAAVDALAKYLDVGPEGVRCGGIRIIEIAPTKKGILKFLNHYIRCP